MAIKRLLIIMATCALAGSAIACGASQGAGSSGGSASPTAAAEATLPAGMPTTLSDPACGEVPSAAAGKWTMTLTPQDLPPELFDADTGVFVMTLGPGHYVRTDVDSDHRGDDEDLCWTTKWVAYVTDRRDCDGDTSNSALSFRSALGVYEWLLNGDELTFTALSDECFWRPFLLTFNTWTRVPA